MSSLLSKNTSNQDLYIALEHIGLTTHECQLYLLSLELGPTSIPILADKLGISRPNMYKIIQGLAQKGLAYLPERKRYARAFIVESPSVVMDLVRKKHDEFKKIDAHLTEQLPSLLQQYQQGTAPTKVKLISGEKDFLKAYVRVFEEATGPIQFFGDMRSFIKMIGSEFGRMRISRRVDRHIPVQAIALPGYEETGLETDPSVLREVRILKGASPFVTSFYLYANKAILWQPKTPMAILIEDAYLVEMLRSMFFLLWEESTIPKSL